MAVHGQYAAGNLQFDVDANLLVQLGEQLVTRRSIALAELVKNAYDADATSVDVVFRHVTTPNGSIEIRDTGHGMTLAEIQQRWMRIAHDEKARDRQSRKYHRSQTGAKGIGRFAARKLASRLILDTVAEYEDDVRRRVVMSFDWDAQFGRGISLKDVSVPYELADVSPDTPTGVTLLLENLRDEWGADDFQQLNRDLFTLTSPFPAFHATMSTSGKAADPGFIMRFDALEYPEFSGELGEQFLETAWAVLTGMVGTDGKPSYVLDVRTPEEAIEFLPETALFPALRGAAFILHYFVYKSTYFAGTPFSAREAARKGRNEGGIRIYLDGFRVFPYGDPSDDWLQLNDIRAGRTTRLIDIGDYAELGALETSIPGRPYLLTPGNNQVFGAVFVSQSEHPEILPSVSRERLVENDAYNQLRAFVQLGIYWMTVQYARLTIGDREARKISRQSEVPNIIEQVLAKISEAGDLPLGARHDIIKLLEEARATSEAETEAHITERSMLRVLSSTGATISMVNHQLRAVLDGIRTIRTDLREMLPCIAPSCVEAFEAIVNRMGDWQKNVIRQVSQLSFLLGIEARTKLERHVLRAVVESVISPLSRYADDYGIQVFNDIPRHLRTPQMYEAELYAILLHVFTNALKAVRERQLSQIAFRASSVEGGIRILVLDTGVGIAPEKREDVFKPFVTSSTPDPIFQVGTGLGLPIVRDMLAEYGGVAKFVDAEAPWKTCLEIFIPQ